MAGGGSVHAVIALVALLLILAIAAATGAAPNTLGTRGEEDCQAAEVPLTAGAPEDICQACPAECRGHLPGMPRGMQKSNCFLPPPPPPADVCGNSTRNPCKYGSCISGGPGSYSCVCPPYRVPSKSNGYPTCDYGSSSPTLKVQGDNWRCEDVYPLYGLTLDEFTAQNNAVDCSTALTRGQTLNVTERGDLTSCSVFYYIQKGDTCESVSQWQHLSASPSNLCSSSTPALTAPRHSHLSAPPPLLLPIPKQGDTCESVAASLGISSLSLESLNPGVHCSSPLPPSRSLCMEREDGADDGSGEYCNTVYSVSGTSSCAQVVNDFEFSSSLELYRLNPGLVCYSSLTANREVSVLQLTNCQSGGECATPH
ncbi:unnamed protein product [Closterium sp. NIES-65]|nr:unnamed protein product [Closterium sp. NIES-65]